MLFSLSKKKGIFDIQIEQPLFQVRKHEEKRNDLTNKKALSVISNDLLLDSKALGHNDLSVNTKYLHTELTDIADKLKDYF